MCIIPVALRSFGCVHGREHHVSRGDRGGDGSYPAPARGPGAPGVRAALHVSCLSVSFSVFVALNVTKI